MCDIVQSIEVEDKDWFSPDSRYLNNIVDIISHDNNTRAGEYHLKHEIDIRLNSWHYEHDGQLFCKHPGTDWHLMEVPQGEFLSCPAETTLRLVYPSATSEIAE